MEQVAAVDGVTHADATPEPEPQMISPDDHIIGSPNAEVILIQYGEFECPECGRSHHQLKQLREQLNDFSAAFVFRHFARDEVHPYSVQAAIAAEAAGRQGRFWEMHDQLFQNQHSLLGEDLKRHAEEIGLLIDRFDRDMADPRLRESVTHHLRLGLSSGVTSTPTLFINGKLYEGRHESSAVAAAINRERNLLTGEGVSVKPGALKKIRGRSDGR